MLSSLLEHGSSFCGRVEPGRSWFSSLEDSPDDIDASDSESDPDPSSALCLKKFQASLALPPLRTFYFIAFTSLFLSARFDIFNILNKEGDLRTYCNAMQSFPPYSS